jgi:hypothetical protein
MAKRRLTPKQYRDEFVYRQIKVTRYATGQANYVQSLINKLNDEITKFCLQKKTIETKKQYADCKKFIRTKCIEYREKLYKYLQKELRDFVIEQSKWVYANSPVELEKANVDRILKDVFFTAYSDTDNIKSYIKRIFDQIFSLYNSQLSIAYRTGESMKDMIMLITSKEFK